ncbi:Lysine Methyltransferase 2D [Paramecium bursaria]
MFYSEKPLTCLHDMDLRAKLTQIFNCNSFSFLQENTNQKYKQYSKVLLKYKLLLKKLKKLYRRMGQQQSQELQQSRISMPNVGDLNRISQGIDVKYGDVKIMEKHDKSLKLAVKTHVFQDEQQYLQFKGDTEKDQFQGENFIIKLIEIQHLSEKELCTQMIQAHCIYEYYNYDLKDEIKIIKDANKLFQEIEIVAAIYCLITGIKQLNIIRQYHGDIRPLTVIMTNHSLNNGLKKDQLNPIYKITDIQRLSELNAYKRQILNMKGEYNNAPEVLPYLKSRTIQPQYDQLKADIFCVGLIGLEMGTLSNLSDISENLMFKPEILNNHLQQLKRNYNEQLFQLISSLLQISPIARPDCNQVYQQLNIYRYQLEDYFHNSILQNNYKLDLSMTFKTEQSKQNNLFGAMNNITNQIDNIEELDQRAKISLKRSYEAQLRYLQSPLKLMKNDHYPVEPTNNHQHYDSLPSITTDELKSITNLVNQLQVDNSIKQSSTYNYQYQNPQTKKPQVNVYKEYDDDNYDQIPQQSIVEQYDPTTSNRQSEQKQLKPSSFLDGTLKQQYTPDKYQQQQPQDEQFRYVQSINNKPFPEQQQHSQAPSGTFNPLYGQQSQQSQNYTSFANLGQSSQFGNQSQNPNLAQTQANQNEYQYAQPIQITKRSGVDQVQSPQQLGQSRNLTKWQQSPQNLEPVTRLSGVHTTDKNIQNANLYPQYQEQQKSPLQRKIEEEDNHYQSESDKISINQSVTQQQNYQNSQNKIASSSRTSKPNMGQTSSKQGTRVVQQKKSTKK